MKNIYYFDELMKVYINIKNIKGLHPHQILNKRIGLMKKGKEAQRYSSPFLGERFDEKILKDHCADCHHVILTIHQFIGFSPINKSVVEPAAQCLPLCDVRTLNHVGAMVRNIIRDWRKKKGIRQPANTTEAFGGQKAIAH